MAKLIIIPNFYLENGIKFSQCLPSERCPSGIEYGSTREASLVELVIQLGAANEPVKANAYQPDFGTCSRDPEQNPAGSDACRGNFQFEGTTLAHLIKYSPSIQESLGDHQGDPKRGEIKAEQISVPDLPDGPYIDLPLDPMSGIIGINWYSVIGLVFASCVAVTIANAVRRLRKRNATLKSIVRAGSHKQNKIMSLRASSIQAQASDLTAGSLSDNNRSSTGSAQPDIDQKVEEILSRLDSLEQQMVSVLMKTSIKSEQMDESG